MKLLTCCFTLFVFASVANASEVNLNCILDSDTLPLPFNVTVENGNSTVSVNDGDTTVDCSTAKGSESNYEILCENVAEKYEAHDAWIIKLNSKTKNGDFTFRAKDAISSSVDYPFTCI